MEIVRVIGIGFLGAILSLFLKESKPEFVVLSTVATGVVILILVLNSLSDVIEAFTAIVDKTNIDSSLFTGILKIIGIGYITEYSSEICADMKAGSIANKIQFAGKITIFMMALPIITAFIDIISMLGS